MLSAAVPTQRELEQRVSELRGQSSHVPTEDELAQRVSKLRGQSSHVPTEDELAQRVAKLSGRGAGKPTASLPVHLLNTSVIVVWCNTLWRVNPQNALSAKKSENRVSGGFALPHRG